MRQSDAESLLGSTKAQVRVHYAKHKQLPSRLMGPMEQGGMALTRDETQTHNHILDDQIYDLGNGKAVLVARPRKEKDGWGAHVFDLKGGSGTFHWQEFDTEDELQDWLAKVGK